MIYKYIYKNCKCGKGLFLKYFQRKQIFCNVKCRVEATKNRKQINCLVCNKNVTVPKSRPRKFCSFSCRSIYTQAKWHNTTLEEYKKERQLIHKKLLAKRKSPWYKRWRKFCLTRDNNECTCWEEAECVHHIIPVLEKPELILEKTNWISLCNLCHKNIHYAKD